MSVDSADAPPVIVLVGPTASGKSDVAQAVAECLNGEVLSADSMQVYKGMDIGTGKVPPEERRVPHFGLDIVDPGMPFSAALYQTYARETIADIAARGDTTVLAGGTGFYIRAVVDDYRFASGEQVDNPVRECYMALADEQGSQAVWDLLQKRDPKSAAVIHPNNTVRVVRALEMLEAGERYADRKANLSSLQQHIPAEFFGLHVDPDILRRRIDARVDHMLESGLIDEVTGLLNNGFREAVTAPQAIGYKEIVAYLDGNSTLEEALTAIKTATHRYAKRQRSWFRADKRIKWLNADDGDVSHMAEIICNTMKLSTDH